MQVFVEQLARESVLMLDYDGNVSTLLRRAGPGLPLSRGLKRIAMLGNTRLAIVTGRPVHDIPSLLGGLWEDLRTRPRAIT